MCESRTPVLRLCLAVTLPTDDIRQSGSCPMAFLVETHRKLSLKFGE
jgi:hypothetical protein